MKIQNRSKLYITIIALTALYLRVKHVLIVPFEFKIDAWSMYHYAMNVANGHYYGAAFGDFWARYAYWPPLYIFLSGFIYRFFGTGQDFLVMRLIQAAFSTASCLLAYLIACEAIKSYSRFDRLAGLTAGLLMAFNPRMVLYTNHLYVETVFITLYLLTAYWGLRYFKEEFQLKLASRAGYIQLKHILLFSFFLGLSCLTRPVLLLLPGVLAVTAMLYSKTTRSGLKQALAVLIPDCTLIVLIMMVTFLPWIVRNLNVTGKFILIDTNGPINFYIAHNPLANGEWVDVKPHTDINRLYETGYKEGFRYMLSHGSKELTLLSVKQKHYAYKTDPHETEIAAYMDRIYRPPLFLTLRNSRLFSNNRSVLMFMDRYIRFPRLNFELLWKLTLLLLLAFTVKLVLYQTIHILFSEPAWIIGNVLYTNLIIQLFYFAPRYRIIAEPFLCIAIGILLTGLASLEKGHY